MPACFRYIVRDVDAAIEFYTKQLGFKLEMHPAPPFAEISRGDMHVYLTQPGGTGGGSPMPSGEQQGPGGWNRIHLTVHDLDDTVAKLKAAGSHFRNNVVQGMGGKQILLEDPSGNLIELFEPNTVAYRAPGVAQTPERPDQWAKRVTDTVAGTKLPSTTTRTAAPRAVFLASFATLVLNRPSSNI